MGPSGDAGWGRGFGGEVIMKTVSFEFDVRSALLLERNHQQLKRMVFALIACWGLGIPAEAPGQAPLSRRGVDQVTLSEGQRLVGVIAEADPRVGVSMVVERKWLEQADPKLFAKYEAAERAGQRRGHQELLERIQQWKQDRSQDAALIAFLDAEQERLEEPDVRELTDYRFMLIQWPAAQVSKIYRQPQSRRWIAQLAWKHNLRDVSNRSTSALLRELREQGVDPDQQTVDFSDEIPSAPQSDTEWAARVALVEYRLRQPLDYQGVGTLLVRKGAEMDAQKVLAGLLGQGGQLGNLLEQFGLGGLGGNGPLGQLGDARTKRKQARSREWWHDVVSEAETDGFRGVLITRLFQDIQSPKLRVELTFLGRMSPRNWKPIFATTIEQQIADQDPEAVDELRNSPQVQEALQTLQRLGVQTDQARMVLALQHGAATQKAMQLADQRFLSFQERYLSRLDGPPLVLPESRPR